MSRQIKLNKEQIADAVARLTEKLSNLKVSDKKVTFSYTTESDLEQNAKIIFKPLAYSKMLVLINSFDTEVAWHGVVTRDDDSTFTIEDIIVYPQTVSGGTVNTDQAKYEQWLMDLEDDEFNRLRMQGHSHVNMGTSPSSVDLTHQSKIVDQLKDTDYYIFMIWNKSLKSTTVIYDMANNICYEDDDIGIYVDSTQLDIEAFLDDAFSKATGRIKTPISRYNSPIVDSDIDDWWNKY